jgi:hypothetical protein
MVNGANRTGDLVISGTDTNRQGSLAGLFPNRFYRVVLTVTDLATNTSIYTIEFDTINQNNFTFEAEDWNFTNGMFLDNIVLSSSPGPDNYVERGDTLGIDVNDFDTATSLRLYRSPSLVGTEVSAPRPVPPFNPAGGTGLGDVLRQKYIDAQLSDPNVVDYNVGWTETGEWLNYTRSFPPGKYFVYGRLSSGVSGSFAPTLAKVAGATTSNQTSTLLGSFKGDTGHGWQNYDFIPLTDAQSKRIVVSLSGVETLRVTAASANPYNANFYMLLPAPILDIALQNGKAVVSWQTNLDGFVLQSSTNLSSANWLNVPNPVFVVNGRNTVTNDISSTSRFFRLFQ